MMIKHLNLLLLNLKNNTNHIMVQQYVYDIFSELVLIEITQENYLKK